MILSLHKKIIVLTLILIIISISIYTLIKKDPIIEEESIKEGMLGLPDLSAPFEAIGQQFKFFEVLGTIPRRIERFLRSFKEATEGIGMFFDNLGWEMKIASTDVSMYLTEFIGPHINCFTSKASVFKDCIMFYVWDVILNILYLVFIYYPLLAVEKIVGVNYTEQVNEIFVYFIIMDNYIFNFAGTHVFKYSDETFKKCYYCESLKNKPTVQDEYDVFDYDFNHKLPILWNEPIQKFKDAQADFMYMFK